MKILIADDHALFRDGLSLQLEKISPQAVINQAANFSQALKLAEDSSDIDLIIIDLDMPDMRWEDGLKEIKEKAQKSKIVVISASENTRDIKKVIEMGVSGYIPKRSETKILLSALKLVMEGGTYLPPSVIENHTSESERAGRGSKVLTPRQSEVLQYVAEGLSNKQIAYKMGVSEATVKLHINALLRAVGATNRTQALIIAQKMGLI